MPPNTAKRGRGLDGRSRVEQTLETAARLFDEKGYEASSMRDIAGQVEIRPSSLYHHFAAKDQILYEICRAFQQDFNLEILPHLTGDAPADAAVHSAVRHHILYCNKRWSQVRVGIRERRSLPRQPQAAINALRREYRDALATAIERGRQAGLFTAPDAKLGAMAVLDMVNGVANWYRPKDRRDLEQLAVRYADAAVAMLRGWSADGA